MSSGLMGRLAHMQTLPTHPYLHVRVVWMNIKTESSSESRNESIALLSSAILGLLSFINPLQLHQVYIETTTTKNQEELFACNCRMKLLALHEFEVVSCQDLF